MIVTKAAQSIAFDPPDDATYGKEPFMLKATASSGLAVVYAIASGPATLSGSQVTLNGPVRVTVKATQTGDANHEAAPEVTHSFCVLPPKPVITATGLVLTASGAAAYQWYLNGTAIAGATDRTYEAAADGSYTVSVTGPCGSAIASDAFMITVSANEPALAGPVMLYPNPAADRIVLQLPPGVPALKARILDGHVKTGEDARRKGRAPRGFFRSGFEHGRILSGNTTPQWLPPQKISRAVMRLAEVRGRCARF